MHWIEAIVFVMFYGFVLSNFEHDVKVASLSFSKEYVQFECPSDTL